MVSLFAVLTSCVADDAGSRSPVGDFSRQHSVWSFDGEKRRESIVVDSLSLKLVTSDALALAIQIYADNGHECQLDGEAHRLTGVWEYTEDYLLDGQAYRCRLRVLLTAEGVMLEDVDHACRLFYCGLRGRFDGLRFKRRE